MRPLDRFLTGAALIAAGAAAPAAAQTDTAWSALFRADLDSAHAIIAANHPGVLDAQNPAFARTVKTAYAEARRAIPQIDSYTSFAIALARFGNRFQDAHLNVGGNRPLLPLRDAGIDAAFRGGAFVVEAVDERYGEWSASLRGATVRDCDGVRAERVFRDRVLSWRGRPSIEADWYRFAPMLFRDYGPPTPAAPAVCRFATAHGVVPVSLQWQPLDSVRVAERRRLTASPPRTFGMERMEEGHALWVRFPTFAVNDSAGVAAMRGTIDSLRAEVESNRAWRLVVLDLRGNDGGSSQWGDEIARPLFGESWARQAASWLYDGVYTEFRVSPQNLEAVRANARQSEQRHGKDSHSAAQSRALADSMAAALGRGSPMYGPARPRTRAPRPQPVPVPGRIVVVAGPSCFSACLDFLDRMRLHPSVVQVGQTTGVDTNYMENRGRRLPSGLASVGYPMKVYRNRRRAGNEAYTPRVPYPGDLRDSEALRAWIIANHTRW